MTNSFIEKMAVLYKQVPSSLLPSIRLAQAILESNWGQSELAREAKNFAGIKADKFWTGDSHVTYSKEEYSGQFRTERFAFRKYPTVEAFIKDHSGFITSSAWRREYYQKVIQATTYQEQAQALTQKYATDSQYGAKLIRLIEQYKLYEYDKKEQRTMLNVRQNLVSESKYSVKCPYSMVPEYITIHNTANKASAENEIAYMIRNNNQVSYHYAVDDKEAVQGLPLDRNGWHCGDGGQGKGNRTSIGIEICYSLDDDPHYAQSEENGAMLTAMLLKKYGWEIDRVRKHQDWSGKYCPHRILDQPNGWQEFLNKVQNYLNTLNGVMTREVKETQLKPIEEIAKEVIDGHWGNGQERVNRLSEAGYSASDVQSKVDTLLGKNVPQPKQKELWVHLPKTDPTWSVYHVNGPYSVAYAIGKLAPATYGGLDYHIECWLVQGQVAQITTQTYGKVGIYIAPGTGAQWYEKEV